MSGRPPKASRFKNIAIALAMLVAVVVFMAMGIRAESRAVSALWFLLALGLMPALVARAVQDYVVASANRHLEALCQEREAAAVEEMIRAGMLQERLSVARAQARRLLPWAMQKMAAGSDEVLVFSSSARSWEHMAGMAAVALVRSGKVVAIEVIARS